MTEHEDGWMGDNEPSLDRDGTLSKLQEDSAGQGAWVAAVHEVSRVGQTAATEQQQTSFKEQKLIAT